MNTLISRLEDLAISYARKYKEEYAELMRDAVSEIKMLRSFRDSHYQNFQSKYEPRDPDSLGGQ